MHTGPTYDTPFPIPIDPRQAKYQELDEIGYDRLSTIINLKKSAHAAHAAVGVTQSVLLPKTPIAAPSIDAGG